MLQSAVLGHHFTGQLLSRLDRSQVVLFFYPADNTPGCTKQACAFRDNYDVFKKAGATGAAESPFFASACHCQINVIALVLSVFQSHDSPYPQ